jgi:hypothetical protein
MSWYWPSRDVDGNPDARREHPGAGGRTVKPAGKVTWEADTRPTMHETRGEWKLASGSGGIITWDGGHVRVAGEGPGRER